MPEFAFRKPIQIACIAMLAAMSSALLIACTQVTATDTEDTSNLAQRDEHPSTTDMAPSLALGDACDPDSTYAFCGSTLACDPESWTCQKALYVGISVASHASYTDLVLSNPLSVIVTLYAGSDRTNIYATGTNSSNVAFFKVPNGKYQADVRVLVTPNDGSEARWFVGHTGVFSYDRNLADSAFQLPEVFPETFN